jgi:hypothetical protein
VIGTLMTPSLRVVAHPFKDPYPLRFSGDGRMLIAGTSQVCGFRLPSLERTFQVRPLKQPHGFCVQPAGGALVCVSGQGSFALLDGATGATLGTCDDEPIYRDPKFALSACGRFVIYAWRDRLRVREFATGQLSWERRFVDGWIADIQPVADGHGWMLSVYTRNQTDPNAATFFRLEFWSWPFASEPQRVFEPGAAVDAVVSRGGRIATLGGLKLHVYLENGEAPTAEQPVHYMEHLLGWIDEDHFACTNDPGVEIREARNGIVVRKLELPGYSRYACQFSPDGKDLAVAYGQQGFAYVRGAFDGGTTEARVENPWPPKPSRAPTVGTPHTDPWYRPTPPKSVHSIRARSLEELKRRLWSLHRPTWTPIVAEGDGAITSSKFGGMPCLTEGEMWPRCGQCGDWLQLALQLNAADLPKEPGELFAGILQVFFCTSESCVPTEPFSSTTLVRLTRGSAAPARSAPPFAEAFIGRRIIGWQSHTDYPQYDEVELLGVHLADGPEYDGELLLPTLEDKLLGWPAWTQNVKYVKCPKCAGAMRVLVQIMSEHNVPFMFGDGGTAWVSQCPAHTDTLAFHCEV